MGENLLQSPTSLQHLFTAEKKFIGVKLLLILIVLPVTVFLAMQEQDTRQRAQSVDPCTQSAATIAAQSIPADKKIPRQVSSGKIIVRYKNGRQIPQVLEDRLQRRQARQLKRLEKINSQIIEVKKGEESQVIAEIEQNAAVAYAEPDFVGKAVEFIPNDTSFNNQYGLKNTGQSGGTSGADIKATLAWDVTKGTKQGEKIRVAVLDTGIDQDHPDFAGKIILNRNFTSETSFDDGHGHGTHVAGILAANTNNATGVAGACPDCVILNGKVLDNTGHGFYSDFAEGIMWAADNGAKVINMSLAGANSSQLLTDAVQYAQSKGAVVVAAAGNDNTNTVVYPAGIEQVIAVGATTNKDQKSSFSNYGASWVDVAAPGTGIFSTFPNHSYQGQTIWNTPLNYGSLNGTSMAAPHVSALAALVYATQYGTSPESVRSRIESTADQLSGTESYWKYGRINATRAVGTSSIPTSTPTPVISSPTPTQSAPTPTPCDPLPTPTGHNSPTATPTQGPTTTPSPTTRPTPSVIPTATRTPIPTLDPLSTKFPVTIFIQGIGRGGDNVSPGSTGNTKPARTQREIQFTITDKNDVPVTTATGFVTYNSNNGNFTGTVGVSNLSSGSYLIRVKSKSTLTQLVTRPQQVTKGGSFTLPPLTLVTGDVSGDNKLNILDYNRLMEAYKKCPANSCTADELQANDLDDNGKIEVTDYNLLIRNFSVQTGK